jgi:hypothetical protein
MHSRRASTVSINTSAVLWHMKCSKRKQQVSPRLAHYDRSTQSHIPEDWNLQKHRCDSPKISGKSDVCRTADAVNAYCVVSGLK